MEEVSVPRTEAQAGLPALVEMGLAKECDECAAAKKALAHLVRVGKGLYATAQVPHHADPNSGSTVHIRDLENIDLNCRKCKDTGVVPTEKGWRVIGLVKMFLEDASGRELGRQHEIPF